MNSSTSSSNRGGRHRRCLLALGVLAASLLLLEIFTRTWLFSASKDFRRFATYDERARRLVESDGFRVALVGNSATDRGVDAAVFREALQHAIGHSIATDLFVADRSRINTWHFILERYFFSQGRQPDLVLLTFYENDLEDGNPIEIGRLAQFFTTVRDWPEVFRLDLPDLNQRAEFLLASVWATFAARERIKERALGALIPGYKPFAEHVNDVNYRHQAAQAGPVRSGSLRALRRLIDRAQQTGVRLCFVAYPTIPSQPYEVNPSVVALIRASGMDYLDLRRTTVLPARLYADEVHLSEQGRPIFSRLLADALAPLLARQGPSLPRQARRRPSTLR
ncbi:MAG: hypothetical protein RMK29_04395 [Myxococcales bacterium]|nr:hypothetical protein [Myxococcota bacterium]MDW8280928.1 hypothetical protein [Myxococcales bacterium]